MCYTPEAILTHTLGHMSSEAPSFQRSSNLTPNYGSYTVNAPMFIIETL
jgi:hypothetical protein